MVPTILASVFALNSFGILNNMPRGTIYFWKCNITRRRQHRSGAAARTQNVCRHLRLPQRCRRVTQPPLTIAPRHQVKPVPGVTAGVKAPEQAEWRGQEWVMGLRNYKSCCLLSLYATDRVACWPADHRDSWCFVEWRVGVSCASDQNIGAWCWNSGLTAPSCTVVPNSRSELISFCWTRARRISTGHKWTSNCDASARNPLWMIISNSLWNYCFKSICWSPLAAPFLIIWNESILPPGWSGRGREDSCLIVGLIFHYHLFCLCGSAVCSPPVPPIPSSISGRQITVARAHPAYTLCFCRVGWGGKMGSSRKDWEDGEAMAYELAQPWLWHMAKTMSISSVVAALPSAGCAHLLS